MSNHGTSASVADGIAGLTSQCEGSSSLADSPTKWQFVFVHVQQDCKTHDQTAWLCGRLLLRFINGMQNKHCNTTAQTV